MINRIKYFIEFRLAKIKETFEEREEDS